VCTRMCQHMGVHAYLRVLARVRACMHVFMYLGTLSLNSFSSVICHFLGVLRIKIGGLLLEVGLFCSLLRVCMCVT